jgi:hypothetical protein
MNMNFTHFLKFFAILCIIVFVGCSSKIPKSETQNIVEPAVREPAQIPEISLTTSWSLQRSVFESLASYKDRITTLQGVASAGILNQKMRRLVGGDKQVFVYWFNCHRDGVQGNWIDCSFFIFDETSNEVNRASFQIQEAERGFLNYTINERLRIQNVYFMIQNGLRP